MNLVCNAGNTTPPEFQVQLECMNKNGSSYSIQGTHGIYLTCSKAVELTHMAEILLCLSSIW
jgi:hypothetical protein